MFDLPSLQGNAPVSAAKDIDALAQDIYALVKESTVTYSQVKKLVAADTDVYSNDVAKAMRKLKAQGRTDYDRLTNATRLTFT